jgi:hypothetical protein
LKLLVNNAILTFTQAWFVLAGAKQIVLGQMAALSVDPVGVDVIAVPDS